MKLKNLLAVTIIFVTLLCCGITASATTYNGTCGVNGDNVTWKYDTATYTLTISGVAASVKAAIVI